jgi:tetratricopeptide (TPR) repeat protein
MKKLTCLLFTYILLGQLHAQVNQTPDTVSLARSLAYKKNFTSADRLLLEYNRNHNDINALRLHAQVLYWMKAFDRSIEVYEKAISVFREPSLLHLDYARVLYNLNRLTKAERLLEAFRAFDSSNAEAEIMIAYIKLWNGRVAEAEKAAKSILKKYPGNAEATDILTQIKWNTVPYIKTGITFQGDDQPLNGQSFEIETGVYRSWIFSPVAQASLYQFKDADTTYHASWLRIRNSIQLNTRSSLMLEAGAFKQHATPAQFTGSAVLSQNINRHLLLQAGLERKPYQYALASIKTPVLEDVSRVSLSYNGKGKWIGKAGYEMHQYADHNRIRSCYLWFLGPLVSKPHFTLNAGYAFRFSNAGKNNYVTREPLSELATSSVVRGNVAGVYNPYFTPAYQVVHSGLAGIKITPVKDLEFSTQLNIGLLAKADDPKLTFERTGSEYYIKRTYERVSYTPVSWVTGISIPVSGRISVTGNYSYDQLLYYTSHQGSIQLKYLFIK